jgi:NTE family protein
MMGNYSLDTSPSYLFFEGLTRMFSPYDLNPMGFNPLRSLLDDMIDFDRVNSQTDCRSTSPRRMSGQDGLAYSDRVNSGRRRCSPRPVCRRCFPAVEIDGEAYWDGGFSGNPALYPLLTSTESPDIFVVQINPIVRAALPRTARDIMNRVNEISFNSSLVKELRGIELMQRVAAARGIDLGVYTHTYLHLIHTDLEVKDLVASSKLNAEWTYLRLLFDLGRKWADAWLEENFEAIGNRSTLDLDEMEGDARLPLPDLTVRPAAE